MRDVFISTQNYQRFEDVFNDLAANRYGVDMAAVIGRAGRGKTTAGERLATQFPDAIYVRPLDFGSPVAVLREVAFVLGGVRPRNTTACYDVLKAELTPNHSAIIVDEADRLGLKHLNVLRDISDHFTIPVILVGEEPLAGKLRQERRLHSRLRDTVAFGPITPSDVLYFYRKSLSQAITPDQSRKLARHAEGDFRLVIKDALRAERILAASGLREINDQVVEEVCK
ncbi:MAG: hypothetical protein DRH56_06060 [Deltaproteobacteria bacterium]|nr:MAG: hypothetical protein DRH56_06060 [Deltaproteobacteria bacterium]